MDVFEAGTAFALANHVRKPLLAGVFRTSFGSTIREVQAVKNIAIRRLRILPVPLGEGLSKKHQLVILAELTKIGVRVRNPELLDSVSEAFLLDYQEAVRSLVALRGGDVDYVPLFMGFPNGVPDEDEYFARRILGYLGNFTGVFADGPRLESGVAVPEWLFDLREFGADPITQMQSSSLWRKAKQRLSRRKDDEHVEWLDVELVPAEQSLDRLRAWLVSCLEAKSSIKEALHEDVRRLIVAFGPEAVDFDRVTMKENQALLLRTLWESDRQEAVVSLAKTATDVLRLFAALTDTDVSLAGKVRFPKLSRAERRLVLAILEGSPVLAEDLSRYRGLWLEIGRYIHPGEYRKVFPKTAQAFDALRNGKIRTFNGRTEVLLELGDLDGVLTHLSRRPGLLARKVHELLRRFPGREADILDVFRIVSESMTVKSLLVLRRYFATINKDSRRTVITKRGSIKVLPNNAQGALSDEVLAEMDDVLYEALIRRLAERESWDGRSVWIDPRLSSYTVPLAQRAASDGMLTVGRGSRIPVDFDKVLRLFVYWKETAQRTDLDLSVIQFDADFNYAGHVSYTRLSGQGIVHSGDIQSAPHGAAEFIDITLSALPSKVRYVATQVYRFAGEAFADMECHAGWMVRSRVDANYKSFDIKTVANKFDLQGRAGYAVPLLVDLEKKEIVWVDLYVGSKQYHNRVEGQLGAVTETVREISRFCETRPTMAQLAELHREARHGAPTDEPSADVTFGVTGTSYDAGDVEKVLAELL